MIKPSPRVSVLRRQTRHAVKFYRNYTYLYYMAIQQMAFDEQKVADTSRLAVISPEELIWLWSAEASNCLARGESH